MQLGRRTRATAQAIGERVDRITDLLRGLVVGLVMLTLAVVALAVRTA